MADVITRLKLESGEYDSKVKRATQGLLQMEQECRKVGGTLAILEKEQKQYVQSLGSMQTVSTTVRGKLGELTQAYTELRVQYNRLTEEEKKGDFGKALSSSLDQLNQRIQQTKKELSDVNKELSGMDKLEAGGLFGGSKISGMLQVFGGNVMTKGFEMATGAVSSMVNEIGDCIKQGVELAKQGEGIRVAFDRLGRGDIMDGLREATHGTVTDLELMKAAVKFNDFKLPVEELGTMLAFAQQKAKDTGQSVDYMVDSIVTGLGRKSLMILDNLGLSATEIKERMKETGDMTKAVGAIIRDQMAAAGDYVETAADRAAQANVSLQNKMEELGRKFAPVEEASNQLWTSMKIGILDIIGGPLARLLNDLTEAGRLKNALNDINGDGGNGAETRSGKALRILREYSGGGRGIEGKRELYDRQVASFQNQEEKEWRKANRLREELAGLRRQQRENGAAGNLSPLIQETSRQLEEAVNRAKAFQIAKNEYIKGSKDILKPANVNINTKQAEQNVASLRRQLKELEEQRKKAVKAGDQEQVESLTKQISQTKTNLGYLDPSATKGAKAVQDDFTEITGLIGNAQEHVSDLQRQIRESWDEGEIAKLTEDLKAAQKELQRLQDIGKEKPMETGLSGFNQKTMGAWMQGRQSDLSKTELGSVDYSEIMGNIADMQTIKSIIEQSMAAGIDAAQFNLEPLWEKVFDGENIPDDVWQNIVDTINAKLAELKLEPIKLDFKTGNITKLAKDSKDLAKDWSAAGSAISSVSAAMSQIDDPAAKVIGTIAQAVAAVALGASQAIAQASNGSAGGPWGWIAFAAAATATMISTIATIHNATGYAQGGIVDGRGGGFVGGMAYSGDNVGNVRLNSGELVLNRAQQNNLANQLEGESVWQNLVLETVISGEDIRLVLNDNGRRTGRGEYVQTNRR